MARDQRSGDAFVRRTARSIVKETIRCAPGNRAARSGSQSISAVPAVGALTLDEARAALAHVAEGERVMARVHALRSAMRRIVEAFVEARSAPDKDVAAINAYLRRVAVHEELVAIDGGFASVRHATTDAPDVLLYFVAEAARELFTRKHAHAIRRCANEECTHYFYDASKNGTRRWCSMAGCGNREKVAALRSRRRTPMAEGPPSRGRTRRRQ
jgi:predicted RNA-binding Zn ribbon-like protein